MTSINEKLGLKPAGTRRMMKLPVDRTLRNALTSARCPLCQSTGVRLSRVAPGQFWCPRCSHTWLPELQA